MGINSALHAIQNIHHTVINDVIYDCRMSEVLQERLGSRSTPVHPMYMPMDAPAPAPAPAAGVYPYPTHQQLGQAGYPQMEYQLGPAYALPTQPYSTAAYMVQSYTPPAPLHQSMALGHPNYHTAPPVHQSMPIYQPSSGPFHLYIPADTVEVRLPVHPLARAAIDQGMYATQHRCSPRLHAQIATVYESAPEVMEAYPVSEAEFRTAGHRLP